MQKIRKILAAVSEKTALPTNQPTSQNQPSKMKMLTERDLLLLMVLRGRRRQKINTQVWVRKVYRKSSISLIVTAVSLN